MKVREGEGGKEGGKELWEMIGRNKH